MLKKSLVADTDYAVAYGKSGRYVGSPRLFRATFVGLNPEGKATFTRDGIVWPVSLANVVATWDEHQIALDEQNDYRARRKAEFLETGRQIKALVGDDAPYWVGEISKDGSYSSEGQRISPRDLLALLEKAYQAGLDQGARDAAE